MFGTALKLLAIGEASRQVGGYVEHLTKRYLILGVAGVILLGAIIFAILAIYWKLISDNYSPIQAALWMACGLLLIALLVAWLAYGTTRQSLPVPLVTSSSPDLANTSLQDLSVDNVRHRIEQAVASHGPAKVMAFALLGGLIVGILSRRMPSQ